MFNSWCRFLISTNHQRHGFCLRWCCKSSICLTVGMVIISNTLLLERCVRICFPMSQWKMKTFPSFLFFTLPSFTCTWVHTIQRERILTRGKGVVTDQWIRNNKLFMAIVLLMKHNYLLWYTFDTIRSVSFWDSNLSRYGHGVKTYRGRY